MLARHRRRASRTPSDEQGDGDDEQHPGQPLDEPVARLGLAEAGAVTHHDGARDVGQERGARHPGLLERRADRRREDGEVDDELPVVLLGQHGGLALEEADQLGVRDAVGVRPDGGEGVTRHDAVDDAPDESLGAVLDR